MAVDTSNHSELIDNLAATPPILNNPQKVGGVVRMQVASVELADNDSAASIYRMFRIKSSDCVLSIMLFPGDTLTAGVTDIGLYRTAKDGGAVAAVACYASANTIATQSAVGLEVAYEARDVALMGQQAWQDDGLTVDPHWDYDIALTLTTGVTDPGTLTARLLYTSA